MNIPPPGVIRYVMDGIPSEAKNEIIEDTLGEVSCFLIGSNVPVNLIVKTLTGKIIPIKASKYDKVIDIKTALQEVEGILVEQQRLVFKGHELPDKVMLYQLKELVTEGSIIHLLLRLRGGARTKMMARSGKKRVLVSSGAGSGPHNKKVAVDVKKEEEIEKKIAKQHYMAKEQAKMWNKLIEDGAVFAWP